MVVIAHTIFVMLSFLHGLGRRRQREEVSCVIVNVYVLAAVDCSMCVLLEFSELDDKYSDL